MKRIVAGKLIYSLINNPSYLLTTGDEQIILHQHSYALLPLTFPQTCYTVSKVALILDLHPQTPSLLSQSLVLILLNIILYLILHHSLVNLSS